MYFLPINVELRGCYEIFVMLQVLIQIWAPGRSSDGTHRTTHVWESGNASGDFLPDSAIALPAVLVTNVICYSDDCKFPKWDVCYTGINSVNYRYRYVDATYILFGCVCWNGRVDGTLVSGIMTM